MPTIRDMIVIVINDLEEIKGMDELFAAVGCNDHHWVRKQARELEQAEQIKIIRNGPGRGRRNIIRKNRNSPGQPRRIKR